MPEMSLNWILVGVVGGLGYLVGLVQSNELLMQVSRILPHVALFRWCWLQGLGSPDEVRFRLLLGFLCCSAGDYILRKPQGFVAGVFGFLLAQLAFIAAFTRLTSGRRLGRPALLAPLGGFAGYAVALLSLLWPHLGELRIPVVAYGLTLAAMGASAWWTGIPAARVGALLFLTSDSLLALDKFVPATQSASGQSLLRFPIIFTYWGALIFLGHSSIRTPAPSSGLKIVR
jgi:alkenylglycerophosphocholine/alkenylglycerophosphoethanolamine hydrolase